MGPSTAIKEKSSGKRSIRRKKKKNDEWTKERCESREKVLGRDAIIKEQKKGL